MTRNFAFDDDELFFAWLVSDEGVDERGVGGVYVFVFKGGVERVLAGE